MEIIVLADILGILATAGFLYADIKQAHKLWKFPELDTTAFSRTHFKVKLFSIVCVELMYGLVGAYGSLSVSFIQLLLNIYIVYKILKR